MSINQSISCGSKVFVIGEYLALQGGPSLVASIEPGFSLLPSDETFVAGSGSPAERLLRESGGITGRLHDPAGGEGGLGRSSAEFALALHSLGTREVKEAYSHFRRITAGDSRLPPSGYDMVAQWLGGAHWITGTRADELDCESVKFPLEWRFLLFTAAHSRKVATHAHLSELETADFDFLRPSVDLARASLEGDDLSGVGEALTHFADELYARGLEHGDAHEDRMALQELDSVAGVKGSGALLADLLIVLLKPGGSPAEVVQAAQDRGLRLFSAGIRLSPGVRAR